MDSYASVRTYEHMNGPLLGVVMTFFSASSFVLICVYLCLVRPQQKQRRTMLAMSTATAFIAQSYMTRMDMGPKLQPPADSLGPVAQSDNTVGNF